MSELRKEIKVYKIKYECDEIDCNGEVIYDNYSLNNNHLHKCTICNKVYTFNKKYPKLKYKEKI